MLVVKCLMDPCKVEEPRSPCLFILRCRRHERCVLLPRRELRRNRLFVIRVATESTVGAGTAGSGGCFSKLLPKCLKLFLKPVTRT